MSSLKPAEKPYIERMLDMANGYVLKFNDATFGEFFRRHNVNIHGTRYQTNGSSKAKKLRSFWEQDPDPIVGKVLSELLDVYEASCELDGKPIDRPLLERSRSIAARLIGKSAPSKPSQTEYEFLRTEFSIPNLEKLPIESSVRPIVRDRLAEAGKAMGAGAHLSVVILCGSVLEAVLLGAAQKEPSRFNKASSSPKDKRSGAVKRLHEWHLAEFIDVASEVGLLKPDVKKFSHGLRDFRNYIHPYQQLQSGFAPDEHTAKVCLQVLKAALASVSGERG